MKVAAKELTIRPQEGETTYQFLERLTLKWWFYLSLVVVPLLIFPLTTKGFNVFEDIFPLILDMEKFWQAQKVLFEPTLMPPLHVGMALVFVAALYWGNKFRKIFLGIMGLQFLSLIYFQAFGITENFGVVLVSTFAIWFLICALPWLWDRDLGKTDLSLRKLPMWRYWVVPLAILAFWDPDRPWFLDPAMFLYSVAPISICMLTPVYLGFLSLLYPNVNMPAFRVTSFVGMIFGVLTIGVAFYQEPSSGIYWLLLHMPLVLISTYCFVLGLNAREEHT